MTALVDVVMPQMGVSVSEGTIVAWSKQVGETIAYEETICEISTDKIEAEVPSVAAGVVAEIAVEIGETVPVGTVLARIAPEGAAAPASVAAASSGDGAAPSNGTAPAGRPRRFSPVVSRMAADLGVDLEQVPGSGRNGRVTKKDLLAFIERGADAPQAPRQPMLHSESPYRPEEAPAHAPVSTAAAASAPSAAAAPTAPRAAGAYAPPAPRPLSRMRATIGAHMKHSLAEAATVTNWMDVDMTGVERARRALGTSALPFIAAAAADALREHPALNAWLEGDQHTLHTDVNLGIAVSLGDEGLLVPVILGAHELSVTGLANRIGELAERARSRRLSPDELEGGTFTISNAGRLGSRMATPIINQPQVAILGVETIEKRPVVVTGSDGADALAIRTMTTLGLSWDHRAMDGVTAAEFLAAVKRRLEEVTP